MNPQVATKSTIGPLRWTVPSATTKGVTYEVAADVVTGELVCDCAARRACWHLKSVASGQAGRPRVRYTPAPATVRPDTGLDLTRDVMWRED